jgi:hypothetical protein
MSQDINEQADEVRSGKGRKSGGAAIEMMDSRVSKAMSWLWSALGFALVSVVGIAANNLYQLNLTVNRMLDNSAVVATQLKDHEDRLRQLERRNGN